MVAEAPPGVRQDDPAQLQAPFRGGFRRWSERYLGIYLSIAPFFVIFIIFGLFPIVFAGYLAFQSWDGIGPMRYVGLDQFRYLVTDANFIKSIWVTLQIWILSTVPMLMFALGLAFLLNQSIRGRMIYRVAYFIPNVTSLVAIAIIFSSIFGNQFGLLNAAQQGLGLDRIEWLNTPWGIKIAIATMVIWRWTGYNAIIYLAGLQAIPEDLYEAARLDGASQWNVFIDITVPLLRPVILFTVITSTIGGMQLFTEAQVLVGDSGGPGREGLTMVLYLYEQAFVQSQFGYGAAIGWGLFVIIVLFSIMNWRLVGRGGDDNG
ncbi:MAG: sugar ABC transporter permease [Chloroflexia bacterium]|jgi:cellobiose transport system permease protein|nr:sugar ABC transporter permease [Chloroflexia bacterium]